MIEKITIDMLTADSVSIKKQNYTVINGTEYEIGEPWRRAYVNSTQGRTQLQAEVEEPYLSSILGVWGDTATIVEETV